MLLSSKWGRQSRGGGGGGDVPADPLIFYDFEAIEGGLFVDQSGNGNDAEVVGGLVADTNDPAFGLASYYSATTGRYLDLSANDPITSLTQDGFAISLWAKFTSNGTMYLWMHDPKNGMWRVRTSSGIINADIYNYSTSRITTVVQYTTPINDGEWHHIVFSYERTGNSELFVDGVLRESVAMGGHPLEEFTGASYYTSIGARTRATAGTLDYFQGYLDQLRIYGRALTQSDVDLLFAERVV